MQNEPYIGRIKSSGELLREINMNATLARIQDFKKAAKCSAWFYKLLEDMLLKHIDKCPLTMFMAGKLSCVTLYRLNKECGGEWPGVRGLPLESLAK